MNIFIVVGSVVIGYLVIAYEILRGETIGSRNAPSISRKIDSGKFWRRIVVELFFFTAVVVIAILLQLGIIG